MVKTAKPQQTNGSAGDGAGTHPPTHNQLTQHEGLTFLARHKALDDKMAAIKKKRSMLRREIKNSGMYLEQFDKARKLYAHADMKEAVEQEQQFAQWCDWLGMREVQMALFEQVPDKIAKPSAQQSAREAGLIAGMLADNRSTNPHDEGTQPYQEWDNAWHEGQGKLKDKLKEQGAKL